MILTRLNLPSLNRCAFRVFFPKARTSSGVKFLNGWFNATMCIEKPNTKIASTTKNRPKSFIKSPMMIAHGPNKWWNDRKSKICTQANRNDRAKHWFRQYISVGQYSIFTKNIAAFDWNWERKLVFRMKKTISTLILVWKNKKKKKKIFLHLPTWTPTPAIPNKSTSNLMKPNPLLSLGFVNSNSNKPDNMTSNAHSYQYGNRPGRTTGNGGTIPLSISKVIK